MNVTRLSKGEIVADIRAVARMLGHSPSSVEYRKSGRFDVRTVQRKFRQPWSQIISTAGLRYSRRTSGRIVSNEELRRDLLRVTRELGHPPTRTDYQQHGIFDAETMRRRSGEKYWADAIAALTEIDREEIKQQQARGGCYRTTNEWLTRLKDLSQELGHAPTTGEANKGGINAHELCKRVGGTWVNVLKAAHIDIRSRGKRAILLTTPTEVLIEDVVAVARRLGRAPKAAEYAAHGQYSFLSLRGRLGGWRQVKELVTLRLSLNQPEPSRASHSLSSHSITPSEAAIRTFFNHATAGRTHASK